MGSQPRHVYVECGECKGCKVCRTLRIARPQETDYHATPCDCPCSVSKAANTTTPPLATAGTAKSLDEQAQRMLAAIPPAYRTAWLAGVRFALGHAEYGDTMQRWSDDRLAYEHAQENADAFNYATERAARKGSA